jgi:hypothetical protein
VADPSPFFHDLSNAFSFIQSSTLKNSVNNGLTAGLLTFSVLISHVRIHIICKITIWLRKEKQGFCHKDNQEIYCEFPTAVIQRNPYNLETDLLDTRLLLRLYDPEFFT